MEEQIKKIVRRLFPELTGQYHLPRLARVVAIADAPAAEQLSDTFRPYHAVDVQILDQHWQPDAAFPVLKAVPFPAMFGGNERGMQGFALEGSVVEIAWANGMPHQPFIRTVLPIGNSLPACGADEMVWQSDALARQKISAGGDWVRETHGAISDHSLSRSTVAQINQEQYGAQSISVTEHSNEEVVGIKRIEALGALKLLTGGHLNCSAAGNLNQSTASDINSTAARDMKERIGEIKDSLAVLKQLIKVKDGGTVWLGSEGVNVLQVLSDLIQIVQDIANTASSHSHPSPGTPPSQSADFSGQSGDAGSLKSQLDPIIE